MKQSKIGWHKPAGRGLVLLLSLLLIMNNVHAAWYDSFLPNFITDPIQKVMQGMQIFMYDFNALLLDIFTIVLFLVWIFLIILIIYGIVWIFRIPKKVGAANFTEMIQKLSLLLWKVIR